MDAPMCKTCKARHWGPCFTTKAEGHQPSPPCPESAKAARRPQKAGKKSI